MKHKCILQQNLILQTFTIKNVNSIEDYKNYVIDFNKRNHNYDDEVLFWQVEPEEDSMYYNGVKDLYDITSYPYHSDYLYILNISSETVEFKAANAIVQIPSEVGAVFNYDEFEDVSDRADDHWASEIIEDPDDAITYIDEAEAKSLVNKYDLTEEEADELVRYHMSHPHDIIGVYESAEDVAEIYLEDCCDIDDFLKGYIDTSTLGRDLVNDDECYYEFECSGRILYYQP
jgi:hypothetical protein